MCLETCHPMKNVLKPFVTQSSQTKRMVTEPGMVILRGCSLVGGGYVFLPVIERVVQFTLKESMAYFFNTITGKSARGEVAPYHLGWGFRLPK